MMKRMECVNGGAFADVQASGEGEASHTPWANLAKGLSDEAFYVYTSQANQAGTSRKHALVCQALLN